MTRMLALLLAVGAGAAAAAPAAQSAAAVALRAESVVAGPYFSLGEIAEVGDAGLAALRIGHSPRAGSVLRLTRAEVERALLRLAPQLRGALELGGPEAVVVRRGPLQQVEIGRLREAAQAALRGALAERYPRFEIDAVPAEGRALGVPQGVLELRARLPELAPPAARTTAWVDVHVDARLYQSVPLAFDVRAWQPVWVARRALAAGTRIAAEDFERREEQVAGRAEAPLPAQVEAAALRLKQPLAAGGVLSARHIERAPAVAKDQEVRVQLSSGAIAVETVAIATRDAAAGEVLRVRSLAGSQTYPARVTAAGVVEALWR